MLVESVFSFTTPTAILLCFLFGSLFVGSLYIWYLVIPLFEGRKKEPSSYLSKLGNRDDPFTIRCRICSIFCSTSLCVGILTSLSLSPSLGETLACLGWDLSDGRLLTSFLALLLVAILFLGPLVQFFFDRECPIDFSDGLLFPLRNLVIGPITEEIVFRGCMVPVLLGCGMSRTTTILISPLFFGVAHIHHIFAGVPLMRVLFQFSFTTVFGWMSSFFFVRTGNILSPILAHSFCNMMGFPRFDPGHPQKYIIGGSFVVGLILFFVLAGPLTDPSIYNNTIFYD